MKYLKYIILLSGIFFFSRCSDYLNVVPDMTATLEHTFSTRSNAENFFYSCYNSLPNAVQAFNYPGHVAGGDEIWWDIDVQGMANRSGGRIAQGQQNITNPYQNYWDGANDGKNLWRGIRDCNIFLNSIDAVPDIEEWERLKWKAEVKFLKAYFHFFLMQLYGPVPIIHENLEINSPTEEVRVYREPVDDVVDYIIGLIDEAMPDLPLRILDVSTETGRITQAIATAVKAKVLVWAASPLFNGSYAFYRNLKDNRDVYLFPQQYDAATLKARWERAATAVKNAIDTAHLAGHILYRYQTSLSLTTVSDTTAMKYTLRGAATDWTNNREIIWACMNGNDEYSKWCVPKFYSDYAGTSELSATLKMAETYYTRNGLPIDVDPYWEYDSRYEVRADTGDWHQYYVGKGESTVKLHYYREPRFYAHLGFDRSIYELSSLPEAESVVIKNRSGEQFGVVFQDCHISTGYFIKKMVHLNTSTTTAGYNNLFFPMPLIRLADLYLLYAEALNEIKDKPDDEVYRWVDSIRLRAGLNTVLESWRWAKPANQHDPEYKETMREIIKRERLIELAFEGQRPFDLRRWRDSEKYLNEPVRGWDFQGSKIEEYYLTRVYFNNRRFTYKDYLWPLRNQTLIVNSNLVQNPGW